MAKRKPIQIGEQSFKYKKDALSHFKRILNSYEFGEYLDQDDFSDVYHLLKNHPKAKEKIGVGIKQFRIKKSSYGTKCFELIRSDSTTDHFSYIKCINGARKPISVFRRACRKRIQEDLRSAKQNYFDNNSKDGRVKCQETGELLTWENLNVDHRQPNTFSVIVDRFIEVHDIDLEKIEYVNYDGGGQVLVDENLTESFREYHKEKANLRLVKNSLNLGRSHQARISKQKKDLEIN